MLCLDPLDDTFLFRVKECPSLRILVNLIACDAEVKGGARLLTSTVQRHVVKILILLPWKFHPGAAFLHSAWNA